MAEPTSPARRLEAALRRLESAARARPDAPALAAAVADALARLDRLVER